MTRRTKPPIWVRFLTFLLSVILFISVSTAMMVGTLQILTDQENMSALIQQVLFTTQRPAVARPAGEGHGAPATVRVTPRLSAPTVALEGEDLTEQAGEMSADMLEDLLAQLEGAGDEMLVEFVYEFMIEQFGTQLGVGMDVTIHDVQAFVEESTLKEEMAKLSASLVNDLLTGENSTVLDAESIMAIVEENAALIQKHFGVEMTEEVTGVIRDAIENNVHLDQIREEGLAQTVLGAILGEGSGLPDGENVMQSVTAAMSDLRAYISGPILGICIGVSILCAALILLLCRKWLSHGLYRIGMPLFLAALPSALICGAFLLNADTLQETLPQALAVVGSVSQAVITMVAPIPLGVFGGGVVLLVASLVIKVAGGRKRQTEEATAAFSDALIEEEPILICTAVEEEQKET